MWKNTAIPCLHISLPLAPLNDIRLFLPQKRLSSLYNYACTIFSPTVILLCLYKEPQPQKNQNAPHHRPHIPATKNPNIQTNVNEEKMTMKYKK